MLPAASAGPSFQQAIVSGKFHGHDQPDHAERLAHRPGLAAADRDRVPEQPLGAPGVVGERLGDHVHLAAGVADRLAGVAGLEQRPAPRAPRPARRPAGAAAAPGPPAPPPARPGTPRGPGPPRGRRPRRRRAAPPRAPPRWRARSRSGCRSPRPRRSGHRSDGAAGAVPTTSVPPSANSIVRIGPLNVRRADSRYQIVTASITTIVTSGA